MSETQAMKDYLFTHYGHLIHAENPTYDENKSAYISKLFSSYPITIRDDRGRRRFVRYIDIPYLGKISLDKKLHPITAETTTREQLNILLSEFLRIWTENAENLVLSASANWIARLPIVPVVLNPIKVIIERLWNNDRIDNSELDVARPKSKAARYRKYLKLMEGIGLAQRYETAWLPGEEFTKIQSKEKRLDEGRIMVFSIILEKRYSALKQVFDIANLQRVVKIENAVYMPEIEEEQSVFRDVRSISTDLFRFYGDHVNPLEIESTLGDLTEIGAIIAEDELFAGVNKIREIVISRKSQEQSVQSRWLAAYA